MFLCFFVWLVNLSIWKVAHCLPIMALISGLKTPAKPEVLESDIIFLDWDRGRAVSSVLPKGPGDKVLPLCSQGCNEFLMSGVSLLGKWRSLCVLEEGV